MRILREDVLSEYEVCFLMVSFARHQRQLAPRLGALPAASPIWGRVSPYCQGCVGG